MAVEGVPGPPVEPRVEPWPKRQKMARGGYTTSGEAGIAVRSEVRHARLWRLILLQFY